MNRKSLIIIFLVIFVDLLGFGMIIPILPYYAKSFGASATQMGWLMVCYSGLQFIFSPFWGSLSDRYGRRPILLTSILGVGASMIVLGAASSLFWLFTGRLLAGFFGANVAAASAYIADITPPEKRAKGMGMIGAAFGLGFLFGPAIGGFLSQWGYGTAAFAAGGLSLANFLFALVVLREPRRQSDGAHRSHFQKDLWFKILRSPPTGIPILLFFLVTTGFAQLETVFAFFILERFGLQAPHAGYILALMALVIVLIQGGAIGRLSHKFGEARLVICGTLVMGITLIAASFSLLVTLFIVALIFHALGYSITHPSLMSLTSRHAPQNLQGMTMGIYQSAGSMARVIGPLTAGILYDHLGLRTPFWVAGGFFLLATLIMGIQNRRDKNGVGKVV
ncbi:MAG: hypothetical protein A3I75_01355 [Deltaproteobacteria bacterium RIFCSPLOWO2_02_FULL_50_16]|nr:MAG: hypothetical protein A3B79_05280 [Deltaproteobacteria bacterium RIFCSPHIGHO2_02_FULL_50_15]OGQ58032.1 MAG: hypothetical protein A3I75_01355 [Deltaproteobacteria bacterium RIFCSPLOWO2_02_FULL_50_16]OGQ69059.1 MAG: hypothetical protein A3F89_00585 [Deltaproteobacteria bacterium RIFCSPLOWO2_12_FULL_50_11]